MQLWCKCECRAETRSSYAEPQPTIAIASIAVAKVQHQGWGLQGKVRVFYMSSGCFPKCLQKVAPYFWRGLKFQPRYFLQCWLMVLDGSANLRPHIFSHADWWYSTSANLRPLTFSHAGSIFLIACITFLCSWAIIFLKECYKWEAANIYWCWSVHRPPVHPSTQYCFSKNYYIYNNVRAILFYYYIFTLVSR